MTNVSNDISRLQADLLAIKAGVATLNARIQTLNDSLGAGNVVTPEQAASLDALATDADLLAGSFPSPPAPPPAA